jgi:hypothetical protein
VLRLLAVLGLLGATAGLSAGSAAAQSGDQTGGPGSGNQNTFSLSAEADSLDTVLASPYLPVVTQISASPWGASASLDSLGQSMADAGAPYSPVVYSLPGTIAGLSGGQLPPLPAPPGYVAASYPTHPSAKQTQSGYQLSATTTGQDAKGQMQAGADQTGTNPANTFATAESTANHDGSVTVKASAGVDLLNLANLADVGNLSSTESMSLQADRKPVIKGTTNLGTITLLDKPSGLSGSTANLLGVGVPIPLSGPTIDVVNKILGPGGVKLAYLPQTFIYTDNTTTTGPAPDPSKTAKSVDSGALQVSVTRQLTQPVTTIFTLGRVYVSATNTAGLSPGSLGGPGVSSSGGSGLPAASSPPGSTSGLAGIPPATPSQPPSLASPATTGRNGGPALPSLAGTAPFGPSAESFYLILVLAAAAALGGSQLIRLVAVRLALSHQ